MLTVSSKLTHDYLFRQCYSHDTLRVVPRQRTTPATVQRRSSTNHLHRATITDTTSDTTRSPSYIPTPPSTCSPIPPPPLPDLTGACVCKAGYGNEITDESLASYYSCVPCAAGYTNDPPSANNCTMCPPGSYAEQAGQSTCTRCAAGRFSSASGSSTAEVCSGCPVGKYVATTGASACYSCPPGNICPVRGLAIYKECLGGTYQDMPGETKCKDCPAGRWQDREGSAPLPQVDEHGGPPSHPSQQEAVRVEPRQADPQDQGVGDAAGARAAVGPEQVLSSSCFEPPLSPTWLRIRPEPVPPGAWASAATLGACGSESAAPSFWRGWCEVWCGSL